MERALYQGLIVSGVIAAVAFQPVTLWLMDDLDLQGDVAAPLLHRRRETRRRAASTCTSARLSGSRSPAGLFVITDYYTSTRFRPVSTTARASQTGHATNIIQGLAQGQSTAAPAILLALGILVANELAGIYGIGVAVMAQLSLTGLIVALDAFGPITDNVGGIAEMAELPEEVRNVTDLLDAVGNTTKAVPRDTRSARRCSRRSCCSRVRRGARRGGGKRGGDRQVGFDISQPEVLIGLLIGGMMVYLFAALSIEAVGRAGGGGRGGSAPVPGAARDHGPHRAARLRTCVSISSRRRRSAR